ncbi:MAG: hypothetical protein NVSMB63_07730 [Sediminibacterium sp.]
MMRTTTTLLLAIVLLASCNQYQKTPSGMAYKITKGGSNEKLKNGQMIKLNIEYRLKSKDTTLTSSFGHVPMYFTLDTGKLGKHTFTEIITQCAPGDKVDFVLSIDTLKKMGMIEYNNLFKERDVINGKVEILKTFASQEDMKADYLKELDAEKKREGKELQDYVAKKGIKTQSSRSGVLVEVQNEGTGQKADSGWQASVMYKGYLTNGKVFDSNMVKNGPSGQPIRLTVGTGSVIPGWDEGLRFFAKGGKGRLFIPAMLAYGQQGSPPVIAPFSNLVFDVEIVDVTTPPPPAAPSMAPANVQPSEQPKRK